MFAMPNLATRSLSWMLPRSRFATATQSAAPAPSHRDLTYPPQTTSLGTNGLSCSPRTVHPGGRALHSSDPMSSQLDILCLEPFYGGGRRDMLETVIRLSRHRWTLLKLPPRRIERRLSAAAHWFAEQLSRHWVGRVDVLFTSEALNLADLYRLMPSLLKT